MHQAQPRPISLDFLGMEVFAGFLADWLDFLISEELISVMWILHIFADLVPGIRNRILRIFVDFGFAGKSLI